MRPRSVPLFLLLVGCEVTDPSGAIFSPVAVETAPAEVREPRARDAAPADVPEEVVITSEELAEGFAAHQAGAAKQTDGEDPVAVEVASAPPVVIDEVPAATHTVAAANPGWPVRLLTTIPHAQPPRAVVGLPDGQEVVVTPGAMLPEQGLVILSVGPGTAQVAQLSPAGDHATVAHHTLVAQY